MLAAVEAVTSMSLWQLALFNTWSHEGGGGEGRFLEADVHRPTSYFTCTYVKCVLPIYRSQAIYKIHNPSRDSLCACVC